MVVLRDRRNVHDLRLCQLVLDTTRIPADACVDVSAAEALVRADSGRPAEAFVLAASAHRA